MDEQNIPIDINTTKLLDWLISRRHISKDWQNDILKIREKINNAIQDMPEHQGVIELLSGQHINYFHCLKIIEILKETEADTKNLFGRYGSQRMKDWKDIVQMYEKNSLYLAEAAQVLIRNSNFEVPSLRKQVTKLEQVQAECEKKIKEIGKTETFTLGEFNASCKQLGIAGKNIKKELTTLLNDLPEIYERAAKKTKSLTPTLTLHNAYLQYHGYGDVHSNALPVLSYVIEKGNTTTYEYTYGEKPISIELPDVKLEIDEEPKVMETIDFGDEIDFDISPEKSEIDWGTLSSTDDGFEIVDHTDLDANMDDTGIVVEKSGIDGGIARGHQAFTLLDNPKTRDQFLNDLMELEAFLLLRMYEKSNESEDVLDISQMQDLPSEFQMQTVESLTSMLECIRGVLNEITSKRTQHLHNVKHFPKYIDMLTDSLLQKLSSVDRIRDTKGVLEGKIKDARSQTEQMLPIIDTVIRNTKMLQEQVADDISKKYKGRIVNIIGSVNML
uniref:CDK5 regulatory subunit-associated protein 3 n=1 Tax=Photinus pyralis TaxID=7054 RepID=A0A1Y1MDJ6_PHOPY